MTTTKKIERPKRREREKEMSYTYKFKRISGKKGITVNNGGVSTGFDMGVQPTQVSTPNSRPSHQQVQTSLMSPNDVAGLTTADYIYKNDYNYALSNHQISQQIAADLVALNRASNASGLSGGSVTTTGGGAGGSIGGGLQSSTTATAVTATTATTSGNLSSVEAAILRSTVPIEISETEEITVNGQRGKVTF